MPGGGGVNSVEVERSGVVSFPWPRTRNSRLTETASSVSVKTTASACCWVFSPAAMVLRCSLSCSGRSALVKR